MNTDYKTYKIEDGPSRAALFDACKYAYEKFSIPIEFQVSNPNARDCKINNIIITGVKHADKTGTNLIIDGYIENVKLFSYAAVLIHYDTKKRKGRITILL